MNSERTPRKDIFTRPLNARQTPEKTAFYRIPELLRAVDNMTDRNIIQEGRTQWQG